MPFQRTLAWTIVVPLLGASAVVGCKPAEGAEGGRCRKSSTAEDIVSGVFTGDASTAYHCNEGLRCNTSKEPFLCEPLAGPGQACVADFDCRNDALCFDGRCTPPASLAAGQSCRDTVRDEINHAVCGVELSCDTITKTCVAPQGEGGHCIDGLNPCKEGLVCGPDEKCVAGSPPPPP